MPQQPQSTTSTETEFTAAATNNPAAQPQPQPSLDPTISEPKLRPATAEAETETEHASPEAASETSAKKPISPRQLAANRANALLSHGPTTPEGLAKCASTSGNFRHGLLSQTVVLSTESRARFEAFVDSLIVAYRPVTLSEHTFIANMAVARWRQLRSACLQKLDLDVEVARQQATSTSANSKSVATLLAFRTLNDKSSSFNNAIRHENTFERQFHRAYRQLREIKLSRDEDIDQIPVPSLPASVFEDDSFNFDNHVPN